MARNTMGIGYPYTRAFGRVVRFSSADSRRSAQPRETEVHTDRNFKNDCRWLVRGKRRAHTSLISPTMPHEIVFRALGYGYLHLSALGHHGTPHFYG